MQRYDAITDWVLSTGNFTLKDRHTPPRPHQVNSQLLIARVVVYISAGVLHEDITELILHYAHRCPPFGSEVRVPICITVHLRHLACGAGLGALSLGLPSRISLVYAAFGAFMRDTS